MSAPKRAQFTPDSRYLVYLWNALGGLELQPWLYDLQKGQARQLEPVQEPAQDLSLEPVVPGQIVSREEDLRRERSRTRETGITSYFLGGGNNE